MTLSDDQKAVAWTEAGRGRAFDLAGPTFVPGITRAATTDTVQMIRRHLPDNGQVLDIGCGTGRIALPLAQVPGIQMVGLDASHSMLMRMTEGHGTDGANIWRINARSQIGVPFRDESFDGACCIGVLPHYNDWQSVLIPFVRTLKNGARVLFTHRCLPAQSEFSLSTELEIGGLSIEQFTATLADMGLSCEGVYPHNFASGIGIASTWFESPKVSKTDANQAVMMIKPYLDGLLADETCLNSVTDIEAQIREALIWRPLPPYAYVLARRDSHAAAKKPSVSTERPSDSDVSLKIEEIFRSVAVQNANSNAAFLKYLCVLDPYLSGLCGGESPMKRALPTEYNEHFPPVAGSMRRIVRQKWKRAINYHFGPVYRRMWRRWWMMRR